jgi:predicted lipase
LRVVVHIASCIGPRNRFYENEGKEDIPAVCQLLYSCEVAINSVIIEVALEKNGINRPVKGRKDIVAFADNHFDFLGIGNYFLKRRLKNRVYYSECSVKGITIHGEKSCIITLVGTYFQETFALYLTKKRTNNIKPEQTKA